MLLQALSLGSAAWGPWPRGRFWSHPCLSARWGLEPVNQTPRHGLRVAVHVDLAVGAADVALEGVQAQPQQRAGLRPDYGSSVFGRCVTLEDVEGARERLEADRNLTLGRLANLTDDYDAVVAASRDTNADDEHDPEGATIAFERSQVGAFMRRTQLHLVEIDAAVRKLDTWTYGKCERCGGAIGEERLEARPTARTCIQCARPR
jgi:DnaK suppressor protein